MKTQGSQTTAEVNRHNMAGRQVFDAIRGHEDWMSSVVSLIASENQLSPLAAAALTGDIGNRVAEGYLGERIFPGLKFFDEIEEVGIELIQQLFRADFVDIRPISGTMANMAVLASSTQPGDTILAIPLAGGGHVSMAGMTPRRVFHLNVVPIPMAEDGLQVDLAEALQVINETKPALVVLGGSVLTDIQPVLPLTETAHRVGARVLFDASHVAGLIAGGQYPNPLLDDVDYMSFSTCKTIPGPQHAVVTSHSQYADDLRRALFPTLQSGHHLAETVSAVVTLVELAAFGDDYAAAIIENSRSLNDSLRQAGLPVFGATRTHMTLVDCKTAASAAQFQDLLEEANILVNTNLLPGDATYREARGLRLGVQEATRLGMRISEMEQLAHLISMVGREEVAVSAARAEAAELRRRFHKPQYCFDPDPEHL